MKNWIILTFTFLMISIISNGQTYSKVNNWETNDFVRCSVYDSINKQIYAGGDFDLAYKITSKSAISASGALQFNNEIDHFDYIYNLNFSNSVLSISNEEDGFFVATYIYNNEVDTSNTTIWNIDTSGTLHTWKAIIDGEVLTMNKQGNFLIVGGKFNSVNGIPANNLCLIDIVSQQGVPFNLLINGPVKQIESINNELVIIGDFDSINGIPQKSLAKLDISTGQLISWNPIDSGYIRSAVLHNNLIYAIGDDIVVANELFNGLVAIDLNNGVPIQWNPVFNEKINFISLYNDSLILGGEFTMVDSILHPYLTFYDIGSQLFSSFSTITAPIRKMHLDEDKLYYASTFSYLNYYPFSILYKLSIYDLSINTTDELPGYDRFNFNCISSNSNYIFYGNLNSRYIDSTVSNLIGFNLITNEKHNLPIVNGPIYDLLLKGDTLFIAGEFTAINNIPKQNFAAINLTNLSVLPISFNTNGIIRSLKLINEKLFFGGDFTTVNGQPKYCLGYIDINTGIVNSWNNNISNAILTMEIADNKLFIGGTFTTINGQPRNRLASFDIQTLTLSNWSPNVNNVVYTIKDYKGVLFVGGDFTQIDFQDNFRFAKFKLSDLSIENASFSFNAPVYGINASNDLIYVGGIYTQANGYSASNPMVINNNTFDLYDIDFVSFSALHINVFNNYLLLGGNGLRIYEIPYSTNGLDNVQICSVPLVDTTIYFDIYNPNNENLIFNCISSDNSIVNSNNLNVELNTNGNGFQYKINLSPLAIGTTNITLNIKDSRNQYYMAFFKCNVGLSNSTSFSNCPAEINICEGPYNFEPPELEFPCGVSVFQIYGEPSGTILAPGVYVYGFESILVGELTEYCYYEVNVSDCILSSSGNSIPKIRLFPNPVTNELFFEIDNIGISISTYEIKDLAGRIVHSSSLINSKSIDCSILNRGVYIINFMDSEGFNYMPISFIKE